MGATRRPGKLSWVGGAGLAIAFYCGVVVNLAPARAQINATVQVNAGAVRAVMSPLGIGLHTSQYYNQLGNPLLDDLIAEAGVTGLRFGGGGFADIYHWSVHDVSPWFGDLNDIAYLGPGTDYASFLNLLDQVNGGQSVVTVNYGSALKGVGNQRQVPDFGGQPQEAAAWVAYANGDPSIYGDPNQDIVLGLDAQGNDWKTAGYWARLRASTPAEYIQWATADGVYEARNQFLATNRDTPVGVKYWEIGNETFGTGYYAAVGGAEGFSVDYDYPYNGTSRVGRPELSPTQYGQEVVEYSQLMKSIDPTIKIGAVLGTPPDDAWSVGWDDAVLDQAAGDIDFVAIHWYPHAGNNSNGDNLLNQVRTKLPLMINGTTAGQDLGANGGVRDRLAEHGIPNAEILITEFNYFDPLDPAIENATEAAFVADSYATWLDLGVTSVQYLELLTKDFLLDTGDLTPGSAYYGIRMVNELVSPGESLVQATSTNNNVRVHAARKVGGRLGLMIVNADRVNSANVTVDIDGILLQEEGSEGFNTTGTFFRRASTDGLGNDFVVTVPARSVTTYVIASAGIPGDFDDDLDVDGGDFLIWQRDLANGPDGLALLADWEAHYGAEPLVAAASTVPEPASLALVASVIIATLFRAPRHP